MIANDIKNQLEEDDTSNQISLNRVYGFIFDGLILLSIRSENLLTSGKKSSRSQPSIAGEINRGWKKSGRKYKIISLLGWPKGA